MPEKYPKLQRSLKDPNMPKNYPKSREGEGRKGDIIEHPLGVCGDTGFHRYFSDEDKHFMRFPGGGGDQRTQNHQKVFQKKWKSEKVFIVWAEPTLKEEENTMKIVIII